jgi:DNA-binding NarL/FixJ family response regulator
LIAQQPNYNLLHAVHSFDDLILMLDIVIPDVILIGERLDVERDVLEIVRDVRAMSPQSRRVMIGGILNGPLIHALMRAGLHGYLFNGDEMRHCLVRALNTVIHNRPYLSPTANAEYLLAMQQAPHARWHLDAQARQALRLLASGLHLSAARAAAVRDWEEIARWFTMGYVQLFSNR